MADGCYTNTSKNPNVFRLMLECKKDDREILEKFCDFLGIRQDRISIGHKGTSVALCLSDRNFSTSVSSYGVVQHKSHKETVLPAFCEDYHLFLSFLKGLIDGDGTIHTSYGSPGVSFVNNSLSLCEEIKQFLQQILPEPSSVWVMKKSVEQ